MLQERLFALERQNREISAALQVAIDDKTARQGAGMHAKRAL